MMHQSTAPQYGMDLFGSSFPQLPLSFTSYLSVPLESLQSCAVLVNFFRVWESLSQKWWPSRSGEHHGYVFSEWFILRNSPFSWGLRETLIQRRNYQGLLGKGGRGNLAGDSKHVFHFSSPMAKSIQESQQKKCWGSRVSRKSNVHGRTQQSIMSFVSEWMFVCTGVGCAVLK